MTNLSINGIVADPQPQNTLEGKTQQRPAKMKMKTAFRKRRIFSNHHPYDARLCLLLVATSVLSNFWAPCASQVVEHLNDHQKIRIAEMLHLRRSLGDQIWPGFGQADIPVIFWNESYAFLIGLENSSTGWISVPRHTEQASSWELVPGDDFYGQPYYRQLLPADSITPQAFTVQTGDLWASNLQTKEWILISLSEKVCQDFGPLFPHWLFARSGMSSTERYISPGLLHESFHAFQGLTALQRFDVGVRANSQWSDRYPWNDGTFQENWQVELNLLFQALQAETDVEVVDLTRQFLDLRAARRAVAGLTPDQIEFERQREWVEGLAKHTDIAAWQLAAASEYEPIPEILADPDFDSHKTFSDYWQTELSTLTKRASDEGDGRFYYTGMAQAFLLGRLMPEWKSLIFQDGV